MNWLDGQARRSWLDGVDARVTNALRYYLGPTGVPNKLRAAGEALNYTDAGDVVEATTASQNLWNDPSLSNALQYTTAGAALALPFVSARMMRDGVDVVGDAITSGADDSRKFWNEEAGIFGGVNAKTADQNALRQAQEMTEAGASRDDVWRDTGWFQGVDGKWRFEIDDSGAKYTPDTNEKAVGDVFNHPTLFDAYPEASSYEYARNLDTDFQGNRAFSGSFDKGRVEIHDDLGAVGGRRVMLHELQHGIQDTEDFARGGNPSQFVADDILPLIEEADAQEDMLLGKSWRAESKEEAAELLRQSRAAGERKRALRKEAAQWKFEQYKGLAGEAESRNVEARAGMSADQRRATPPWETQDIPDREQSVSFYGGTAESATTPAQQQAQDVLEAQRRREILDYLGL